MARRDELGSWLEGAPGDPGARADLGVAVAGPGSLGRVPRRLVGLGVDWLLSMAVSGLLFPEEGLDRGLLAGEPLVTLAVLAVTTTVLVGLLGHSVGHRVVGLRVVRVRDVRPDDGAATPQDDARAAARVAVAPPPGLLAALIRTVLLCLVIPAAVWDRDGRGLHDVAAGTVVVRR